MLYEKWFWLEEDHRIRLECILGKWNLWPDYGCRFYTKTALRQFQVTDRHELQDGEVLQILTSDGEELYAFVQIKESVFGPTPRISLERMHRIRFGTSEKGEIRITGMFSDMEANLLLTREWHGFSAVPREGVFYLNGEALRRETFLQYGDIIELPGYRILFLGEELAVLTGFEYMVIRPEVYYVTAPDESVIKLVPFAEIEPRDSSASYFHRAPRILPRIYDDTIKIEEAPELEEDENRSILQTVLQSAMMVIPMMLASFLMIYASRMSGGGGSIMMYSGLVMAISSGSMASVMAVMNVRNQKKRHKEKANRRFEAYSNYLIDKTDKIRKEYLHNSESMLETYPDAETLLRKGVENSDLWNRNNRQDDFLKVRIGMGDIPFQVKIDVPDEHFSILEDELRDKPRYIRDNFETLYNVPILLDLTEHPLIGIVGGEEKKGAIELMQVICTQLCATHSYTDVRMIFFYDENSSSDLDQWEFAKWLPHSFSMNRKFRMTAVNASQISDISYELSSILRQRAEAGKGEEEGKKENRNIPRYVIFLSDPKLVQGELITRYIFNTLMDVGLTTVILSDTFENLPNECRFVLQNDGDFCGIVNTLETSRESSRVVFDKVDAQELEEFAAAISGLRILETGEGGEIPDSVTFFEMYGVHRLSDFHAEELWRKNKVYENVRGLLGLKGGDARLYLDAHEKMHGPHGLVAGTTGSGKSETLQTWLLSLAIEYSPDDIGFFIIDYKGGGMANLFNGLPHLLGSISNLSGAQIRRAMVAIKSENRRRQRMFNAAGVNNINKYTMLYKNGELEEPIPHLFIIIDEFAELKREEPDFMKELISVAQVGRSLGVHLILSTQRPAGTVDDNISSNAKFRLCLRVQTKEDSQDMLGKPDAAYITQAGRCYLQVGSDEVYELFQSGYSGSIYDPDEVDSGNLTRLLTMTGRDDIVASAVKRSSAKKEDGEKAAERTQLDAIKDYLAQIAREGAYREIHRLWLPLLKTAIHLEEIPGYAENAFRDGKWNDLPEEWELRATVGVVDDPANQAQEPLSINFAGGGHHAVIGQVVTGKSTLLQTIVFSLINRYPPDYLNVYGVDFSSRMLSVFAGLPHTGGIMYEGDDEKISRFFNMIRKLLEERKKVFRGGNFSQYYRANGLQYPAILIVIDNFGAFNEKTGENYISDVIRISKEGESNGIFLLLSAGGFSMAEIPNRVGGNIKTCLCLEMKDKFAYTDYLHTMRFDVVPESGVKGRGLCVQGGRVLEYQAALALPAQDDYERLQKIEERNSVLRDAWSGPYARKVPEIPENADWEGFRVLAETQEAFRDPKLLPVGYREDNAEVYSLDLSRMFVYLITGMARSGKTGFLNLMVLSALQKERSEVVLIGEENLSSLPESERITAVRNADDLYNLCNSRLTGEFIGRRTFRKKLEEEELLPEEIFEQMTAQCAPIFLFIENLPWLIELMKEDSRGMSGFLENLARKGEGHLVYLVPCFSLEDRAKIGGYSLADALTGRGEGIHFGGILGQDPYLNFSSVSFVEQSKTVKPGIGQIGEAPGDDGVRRIVVPAVRRAKKVKKT